MIPELINQVSLYSHDALISALSLELGVQTPKQQKDIDPMIFDGRRYLTASGARSDNTLRPSSETWLSLFHV